MRIVCKFSLYMTQWYSDSVQLRHSATPACKKVLEEFLLFCGRYRFTKIVPQYASATCEVWFVFDAHTLEHDGDTGGSPIEKNVCLKIMKNEDEYDREIELRKGIDTQYVVKINLEESDRVTKEFAANICKLPKQSKFFPKEMDQSTKLEAAAICNRGFCLVMECGECNFGEMLMNRKLAGDRLCLMKPLQDIAKFLSHLHDKDLVHCDVKTQNLVLMASGEIKGIDLDGATIEDEGTFGTKISSAFLPPECVGLDNNSNAYIKFAEPKDEVLSLPLFFLLSLVIWFPLYVLPYMLSCTGVCGFATLSHSRLFCASLSRSLAGKDHHQSATHHRYLAVWHAALPCHGRQGPVPGR